MGEKLFKIARLSIQRLNLLPGYIPRLDYWGLTAVAAREYSWGCYRVLFLPTFALLPESISWLLRGLGLLARIYSLWGR